MKIIHLIDYFQPILGYQETFLAREQLRKGHQVVVVTSDRYAPFPDYAYTVQPMLGERKLQGGRSVESGIPVWRLPVRYEGYYRCWLKGLGRVLQELRPDVVHAHNVIKLTSLQAVLLKSRLDYRLLVDDHMHAVNLNQSASGRAFYAIFRLLLAPLYRRGVDALVAITEETAEIARTVFGLREPPVQVIELGVDAELFRPDREQGRRVRSELSLLPGDFVVIYTGKVISAKGVHWLVEALALCPARVKALLLGNAAADYRLLIDRLVVEHGLHCRVLLHPAVKQVDLPGYYAASDAGCWPRETSMAMLEAAACALPIVVVTEGVGARVRYQNGLQYREGDVRDLARCITRLAEDRTEAQAMGRRGRRLVEDHYGWDKISRRFLAAYGESRAPSVVA